MCECMPVYTYAHTTTLNRMNDLKREYIECLFHRCIYPLKLL